MDQLLDEEELYFKPVSGVFDVEQIAARIATLGYSFRDHIDPTTFVICQDEESRQEFQSRRHLDPPEGFPYVLLIEVRPDQVTMYQMPGTPYDELAREFIAWLSQQQPLQVTNDSDTDLTEHLS